MAEEKLIQVNLQLPASELAGLTTFVEQLQSLLTLGTQHTAREQEVNTSFDETRFQSLEETASAAAEIGSAYSGKTVTPEAMLSDISDPKTSAVPDFSTTAEASPLAVTKWSEVTAYALAAAVEQDLKSPPVAGYPVSASSEIPFTQYGNSGMERLITSSPAPLTAEAVSLAFRRDDRRYDNGFPLY